jgi:hypothetical protein
MEWSGADWNRLDWSRFDVIELKNTMASVTKRGLGIAYFAYPSQGIVYVRGHGVVRELW